MLTFPKFTVLVRETPLAAEPSEADPIYEHTVTINHQDQLRAELELSRAGINMRSATFHLTSAWIWASLMRNGLYRKPWAAFTEADCIGYDDAGEEEIYPTPPAPAATPVPEISGVGLTSS